MNHMDPLDFIWELPSGPREPLRAGRFFRLLGTIGVPSGLAVQRSWAWFNTCRNRPGSLFELLHIYFSALYLQSGGRSEAANCGVYAADKRTIPRRRDGSWAQRAVFPLRKQESNHRTGRGGKKLQAKDGFGIAGPSCRRQLDHFSLSGRFNNAIRQHHS